MPGCIHSLSAGLPLSSSTLTLDLALHGAAQLGDHEIVSLLWLAESHWESGRGGSWLLQGAKYRWLVVLKLFECVSSSYYLHIIFILITGFMSFLVPAPLKLSQVGVPWGSVYKKYI